MGQGSLLVIPALGGGDEIPAASWLAELDEVWSDPAKEQLREIPSFDRGPPMHVHRYACEPAHMCAYNMLTCIYHIHTHEKRANIRKKSMKSFRLYQT